MTALDTNIGGANTLGGTLAATLGTLNGGTLGGGANTKKMSKAFGNAWRGAAAYHYYMLSLKQFYDGESVLPTLYLTTFFIVLFLLFLRVMRLPHCFVSLCTPSQVIWTPR